MNLSLIQIGRNVKLGVSLLPTLVGLTPVFLSRLRSEQYRELPGCIQRCPRG